MGRGVIRGRTVLVLTVQSYDGRPEGDGALNGGLGPFWCRDTTSTPERPGEGVEKVGSLTSPGKSGGKSNPCVCLLWSRSVVFIIKKLCVLHSTLK